MYLLLNVAHSQRGGGGDDCPKRSKRHTAHWHYRTWKMHVNVSNGGRIVNCAIRYISLKRYFIPKVKKEDKMTDDNIDVNIKSCKSKSRYMTHYIEANLT